MDRHTSSTDSKDEWVDRRREMHARVEEQKLILAATADKQAETEDRIAVTLESIALTGDPRARDRRLLLADRARSLAEQERVDAEKWRTRHAAETAWNQESDT